jgi:Mce-associated membrane protein
MTTLKDTTEATAIGDEQTVDVEETEDAEVEAEAEPDDESDTERKRRPLGWLRVVAYGVLPGLALLLAVAAGYLLWTGGSTDGAALARTESVRVASEDAIALLSYKPESADKDLNAARDRLTGDFKDAYTDLIRRVVIPGAKEKQISAVVKVSAAASVSATANHAVVLLFANQTVTIGQGAPTDTQPVIRVTLDKVNGRWLVSHFDPV